MTEPIAAPTWRWREWIAAGRAYYTVSTWHVLAFTHLYIGERATMASDAGTVRTRSLAGSTRANGCR